MKRGHAERFLKVVALDPGRVHEVRDLSRSEERAYLDAVAHLNEHDGAASLVEIARRNLAEFSNTVRAFSRAAPELGDFGRHQREARVEANRRLQNFLSSVRQLLDHTELRLKRRYAESPEVYEAFRARTARAFDESFAYRFLYKLRNFTQHCGVPIGYVDFEALRDRPVVEHIFHLMFDAAQLLREGPDVWGSVRSELELKGGRFPVEALPAEVMTELEAIWSVVQDAERSFLEESVHVVVDTVRDAPRPCLTPGVARLWHHKRASTWEFILPPTETMHRLGHPEFNDFL